MSHKEILEQAIQKAIDNGWKQWFGWPYSGTIDEDGLWYNGGDGVVTDAETATIIFNHDFAKALWGEEKWPCECTCDTGVEGNTGLYPNWQIHLQQMVIADNPIKYLGENI